jgi:hypothetical protein
MNILATLIVSFMLNGQLQRISLHSSSIESCIQHDMRIAESAVRAMGASDIYVSCHAKTP